MWVKIRHKAAVRTFFISRIYGFLNEDSDSLVQLSLLIRDMYHFYGNFCKNSSATFRCLSRLASSILPQRLSTMRMRTFFSNL